MNVKKLVVKTGSVCTLRCEKCGEFNPYYKQRGKAFSVEAQCLSDDVFKIANMVETIEILHIAGGEALLHKDLAQFLAFANSLNNIKSIELVSNGTIIPSNTVMNILEDTGRDKIKLLISDYGDSGVDNKSVIDFLKKSKVNFILMRDMVWKDKSDVTKKNLKEEELDYIADNCGTYRKEGYYTLIDGIISAHCPTAGSLMYYLDLYDDMEYEWFDLRNTQEHLILKKLKALDSQKGLAACKYCTPSYEALDIPAGVQITKTKDMVNKEALINLANILESKKPIYMLGCKSKTALSLMDMVSKSEEKFKRIFDYRWQEINNGTYYENLQKYYDACGLAIEAAPNDYNRLEQGIIIVAMEEKYQRKWLKKASGSHHKVIDGYDLVFNKEYEKCIAKGGLNSGDMGLCRGCRASFRSCPVRRDYYEKKLGIKRDKVLRHVADKLGYICNLKCEYCCEFLPQFTEKHKKKFDWKRGVEDIKKLSDSLEYINCLSFSGGDVMLNKDLCHVLDETAKLPNIGDIYILTNGTYIPHKKILDSLKRNKERIHIVINNYECNNGAGGIVEKLKEGSINCWVRPNEGWYDFNEICFRNRTVNELKNIYEHCSFDYNDNYYYIIFDGKMNLRCGVANGLLYYLNKYEENTEDYIDIREISIQNLPHQITLLEDRGYLDICNYCESCTTEGRSLKPAEAQRGSEE